jgi:hypothetical protein
MTPAVPVWARELTHDEALDIVNHVQACLYLDMDEEGEFWSGSRQWSFETLEYIASAFDKYDLIPPADERSNT